MNYVAIPKYKFIPPYPMSELDYELAKGLQEEGSKKLKYLHTSPLIPKLRMFGIIYAVVIVLWLLLWVKIYYLPTPGAQNALDTIEGLFSIIIIGTVYFFWGVGWEFFTCRNYNKRLHKLVKKSETYQDFRENYRKIYNK